MYYFEIANIYRSFIEKKEHRFHYDEHSVLEENTYNSRSKTTNYRKSKMETHCIKLKIQANWKNYQKLEILRDLKVSLSSRVWILHSCQINHIRQAGTIFQIVERCFPNQFLHAKRWEATIFDITLWIPNIRKTSLHQAWANL